MQATFLPVILLFSDTCICEQDDEDSPDNGGNNLVITERVCRGTALSPCICSDNGCKVRTLSRA